jgi:hypothetical protein
MSHWGGKRKHANITLGRKAKAGAEGPLWKAESRAVDLPGPLCLLKKRKMIVYSKHTNLLQNCPLK